MQIQMLPSKTMKREKKPPFMTYTDFEIILVREDNGS